MASKNSNGRWEVTPSDSQNIILNTQGKYIDADIQINKYAPIYVVEDQILKITNSQASINGDILSL